MFVVNGNKTFELVYATLLVDVNQGYTVLLVVYATLLVFEVSWNKVLLMAYVSFDVPMKAGKIEFELVNATLDAINAVLLLNKTCGRCKA